MSQFNYQNSLLGQVSYDMDQSYQAQQAQAHLQAQPQRSVLWMGDIDPWWDENTIKSIWASFGESNIVSIKLIKDKMADNGNGANVNGSGNGNNAGYCFIDFGNFINASRAILKNGLMIPGSNNKFLKLNWASGNGILAVSNNMGNASVTGNTGSNFSNGCSIFVGDLSNDIKEQDLFDFFKARYPSVTNVKIMMDPSTMTSKGYGFVRFANEMEQKNALVECNGAIVNNRPIRVSTAIPKNSNGNINGSLVNNNGMNSSNLMGSMNQFSDPTNTTVFVGGLSNSVNEIQLRSYFQKFGEIIYVKVLVNKGCGFVQYCLRSSAEMAIQQMQGYPIGNSRIRLSWGRSSNQNTQNQQKYLQQQAQMQVQQIPQVQQVQTPLSGSVLSTPVQLSQQPITPQQQQLVGQLSGSTLQPITPNSSVNLMGMSPASLGNVTPQPQPTYQLNLSGLNDSNDQFKLNTLLNAARDGRLDRVETTSNGFIYA